MQAGMTLLRVLIAAAAVDLLLPIGAQCQLSLWSFGTPVAAEDGNIEFYQTMITVGNPSLYELRSYADSDDNDPACMVFGNSKTENCDHWLAAYDHGRGEVFSFLSERRGDPLPVPTITLLGMAMLALLLAVTALGKVGTARPA